nr:2'-5' RNA ligase family protein [Croceicoccus bisphenolivorans]
MQQGNKPRPIIVTAALPPALFAMANRLRQAHFPPERNHLAAHVTLFHAIAPSCEAELRRLLADIARDCPPPEAILTGVTSLGRGTALAIDSGALLAIRDRIADRFAGTLTAQDMHRPRLHVTIQNKVAPPEARRLQAQLADTIAPQIFAFPALEMHFYDGGPWEFAGRWPFRASGSHR